MLNVFRSCYLCGKIWNTFNHHQIQGQEKEQRRRGLNGDDVDPTVAGKGALLDLRSLSINLILPRTYKYLLPKLVCRLTDTKSIMGEEKKESEREEEEERGQWSNPCDFFISCLGYAVGLGHLSLTQLIWFHGLMVCMQATSGGFRSSASSTAAAPSSFPTSSCSSLLASPSSSWRSISTLFWPACVPLGGHYPPWT